MFGFRFNRFHGRVPRHSNRASSSTAGSAHHGPVEGIISVGKVAGATAAIGAMVYPVARMHSDVEH